LNRFHDDDEDDNDDNDDDVRMFRATKRWTVSYKIYRIIESNN